MAKVLTFSREFPSYNPRAGQPTYFREKLLHSLLLQNKIDLKSNFVKNIELNFLAFSKGTKNHTIRAGNRWKAGDIASPRIWGSNINIKSGRKGPYHSDQIIIAPDIEIKKVWDIIIELTPNQTTILLPTEVKSQFQMLSLGEVAKNDGLEIEDFERWFNPKKKDIQFVGQIICWNENVTY
ncbi:MAG: hypothetical protein V4538_16380 [Bacteroidota bacterium]